MKFKSPITAAIFTILLCKNVYSLTIEDSINQFSTEFFQVAAQDATSNLVCSPISVSIVLSMVTSGAVGGTKEELSKVLHISENNSTGAEFATVLDKHNSLKTVQLRLANKIFVENNTEIKPEFQDTLTNHFKSEVQKLDFSDAKKATQEINQWSATTTNDLIKELVQSADVSPDTILFLVNSVYFKGNWKQPFKPENTENKPFHVDANTTKEVPTMFANMSLNWGTIPDLDAQFVLLEYEDGGDWRDGTYMAVILPNSADGIEKLEKNIKKLDFDDFFAVESPNVELSLPKFKIESTIDVKNYLSKLGIENAFSVSANFSGIAEDPPLSITKIVQKAFIEVNEEGTEGGVATGVGLENRIGGGPTNIVFNVNRPFYTVVISNDVILFAAKVVDPSV